VSPPVPAAPPPPADPRRAAIDRTREVARWLVVAFAAIGAVLAGTAPLSNLGKLEIGDWRLWLAAAAVAVGLLAMALAIWMTARVLTPVTTDLATLGDERRLRTLIEQNPEVLRGHGTTFHEFKTEYDRKREAYRMALAAREANPNFATDQVEAGAKAEFLALAPIVDRIVSEGLRVTVQRRFERARPFMFAGAVVAGLAIVVFAWAANPPSKPTTVVVKKVDGLAAGAVGPGVALPLRAAKSVLREAGVGTNRVRLLLASFDGPIEARTLSRGARLSSFAARSGERGVFLTWARFKSAEAARLALHLPWPNTAACRQRVRVLRRTMVLAGQVAGGRPGVVQVLIVRPGDFSFARGQGFGGSTCPS
jgi:hypothetical protein